MATTYKKNAQNVYKVPLYAQFWAWWGLVLGLAALFLGLGQFVKFEIVQFGQFGFVVAGRYFDDLASVFTDKVSDQSWDNRQIYHTTRSRKGGY